MKATLLDLSCILLLAGPVLARATPKGTAGCGKKHDGGFHDVSNEQTVVVGGLNRTYGVNVPKDYNKDPKKLRKVIFDYHGNGGTPKQQWDNSQYYKYKDGEDYLVVYPAGYNNSWQSAPYAVAGVDDLNFTTTLLAHIREEYCVDDQQVYASGKSNGGGFVDYLACHTNGNEFAAFGMAAPALYSDNSENACTIPRAIIESHGENDTTIAYTGGKRNNGTLPDIRTWVEWWAERDGCAANTKPDISKKKGYEQISYSCKGYKDVVVHYAVDKLGHCWADTKGDNSDSARSYCDDHVLDFTADVLGFFKKWNLKNAPHS